MARPDFRAAAARRLSEERELSPAIVSLLDSETHRSAHDRRPQRPASSASSPTRSSRASPSTRSRSGAGRVIREHGVLQPILVRPLGDEPLPADRRRAPLARLADRRTQATIPAIVEEIDDDTALEIAIIENLQREDLSPLDEAAMYDRMVHEHGYSIRKLAQKLGKDKGYIENRLRLADAPTEIRELVSLRKDTLSHAYELMKVEDPKKRRKLAEQVARGELTLIKLRERIEGRRRRVPEEDDSPVGEYVAPGLEPAEATEPADEPSDASLWGGQAVRPRMATRRWSTPSAGSPTPSRISSTSSVTLTSSTRSARPTGRISPKYLTIAGSDSTTPSRWSAAATATGGSDPGRHGPARPRERRSRRQAPASWRSGAGRRGASDPRDGLRAISGHDPCPGRGPSASCRGRSRSCPSPWRSGPHPEPRYRRRRRPRRAWHSPRA